MQEKLYHAAPILLARKSIILPGNYGRIIRRTGETHPFYEREIVLEDIRKQCYPNKPSRLDSCFACVAEKTLRFYVDSMSKKTDQFIWPLLYEVEKLDVSAAEHRADFNVVQPLPGYDANMTAIAHLYWKSELWIEISEAPDIRCEELVTTSPLKIIRQL